MSFAIILFSITLIISLIVLPVSAYGIGREESNKSGPGYQSASMFTLISIFGVILSVIGLLVVILNSPSCSTIHKSIK